MHPRQLENLYDDFSQAVYAFALQLTRNQEAAKDLLQTVFCKIARSPRFTILNPRSFLLRCTYRAYVDSVRRESSQQRAHGLLREEEPLYSLFHLDPDEEQEETIQILLKGMAALPEEQKRVLHLKIWEQRTFRQIGAILDIPANTAASRFRYAIDKIRETVRLEDRDED